MPLPTSSAPAFADIKSEFAAEMARIDRAMGDTAHWRPRGFEGLADSMELAAVHNARFGGEAA